MTKELTAFDITVLSGLWFKGIDQDGHALRWVAAGAAGKAIKEDSAGFGIRVQAGMTFSQHGEGGDTLWFEFVGVQLQYSGPAGNGCFIDQLTQLFLVI